MRPELAAITREFPSAVWVAASPTSSMFTLGAFRVEVGVEVGADREDDDASTTYYVCVGLDRPDAEDALGSWYDLTREEAVARVRRIIEGFRGMVSEMFASLLSLG